MDGIERSLAGMSRRASFDSGMETAGNSLSEHYDQFEKEFRSFFPDLQEHVKDFTNKDNQP